MSSRIRLLMTPISDFDGFIRRHVGWSEKFGLWSFSVANASFVANFSMRSSYYADQKCQLSTAEMNLYRVADMLGNFY